MKKISYPDQIELSNGVPVILQHYPGNVATIYWWISTGSADEAPSQAGFAHFLEHMLFKDTSAKETGKSSTGQTARSIESLGGDINAYTSFDQTVYHVTCASQHWKKVLDHFGKMGKPQKFLKTDFEREREVILEELRKNEDSPNRQLFQMLFSATFSKHPYGNPVIGFTKTLKAATCPKLETFYQQQYCTSNMGLILVGPLEDEKRKKKILQSLESHFGVKVRKKKEVSKPSRALEPSLREKAFWNAKAFDVKAPILSLSFRVPEVEHEDTPGLDLLSSILGGGELSRLYQRLFYKTSLVTDVSMGLYASKDPGMLYIQAEIDSSGKLLSTLEEILSELKRFMDEGPTTEEISRALIHAESEKHYATQTVDGVASRLGFLKFVMGNLQFDQEYLDALKAVDASRLKEIAKKYLDFRRASGAILVPKLETLPATSDFEKLTASYLGQQIQKERSALTPQKKSKSVKEPLPVEITKLPSGLTVCYHPRPQSRVFSIHASVLGGSRLELTHPIERAETDWGSSHMMSLSWTKGTSLRDSQAISRVIEGKAGSLDGFAGRNSLGLQMTGLARDFSSLAELFIEVLTDPIFSKDEVDHAKRIAEDGIRSVEDHSSQLCSKLFLETLFEYHPYGRLPQGSISSIQSIHSAKLRAFHRGWVRPERLFVSISGPIQGSQFLPCTETLDQELQKIAKEVTPFNWPKSLESEPSLRAPRWVERILNREQSHILVGGLGITIDSEERFALRLMQNILGGQSGRLFIELREKKSLAYTVSPVQFDGLERGYIGTYIACAPQKKQEALEGIRKVLERLASVGPSQGEMKRAKQYYLGKRAMELQSDPSLAAHYGMEALYGLPQWTEEQLLKKIHSIQPRDIQKVCKRYLLEAPQVTSIVG